MPKRTNMRAIIEWIDRVKIELIKLEALYKSDFAKRYKLKPQIDDMNDLLLILKDYRDIRWEMDDPDGSFRKSINMEVK